MEISTLIFDLDNTLYPASSGIWQLIRQRIDLFMVEKLNYSILEVHHIRDELYREYGTTLRGLQERHNVDPYDYLSFVHDIPLREYIQPNPDLKRTLKAIPLRKVIFSNADRSHVNRVLKQLGIEDEFEQVIDILDILPYCKPMKEAFVIALNKIHCSQPQTCLMFEDSLENIQTAKNLTMETIYVCENGCNIDGLLQIKNINQIADLKFSSAAL